MRRFGKNVQQFLTLLVILISLMISIISFPGCNDDDDGCSEVEITSVRSTVLTAFQDPSGFDGYVADNQSVFDDNFYACIDKTVDELTKVSNERKDQCDDTFITGSDFWNKCYNEVEVEVDNSIVLLNDIRKTTLGETSFGLTSTGLSLIFLQLSDPAEYNNLVSLVNQIFDELEGEGNCKLCV